MSYYKIILISVLSGALLWLSTNYSSLWFLSLFGLLPLFYLIYQKKLTSRQYLLSGLIAGFVFLSGAMIWYFKVLPLDWAGIESDAHSFFLLFYVWFFSSLSGGWVVAFCVWAFSFLKRNNFFDLLLAPSLWVLFEYVRAFLVSIFWVGDGALLGPHWTIAFLGYNISQAKIFLSLASLGGVFLMSAVVVFVNLLIFFLLFSFSNKKEFTKNIIYTILFIVFLTIFSFIFHQEKDNHQKLDVAVVGTYTERFSSVSAEDFSVLVQKNLSILNEIADREEIDMVIFPEDTRLLLGLEVFDQRQIIQNLFPKDREVLIIDSARLFKKKENSSPVLQYYYLNTKTGDLKHSEKLFLVPHGEYLPYLTYLGLYFSGLEDWIKEFISVRIYDKGEVFQPATFKDFKIGTSVCSEIMSFDLNQKMMSQGSNLLVNTASHSLFGGSRILYNQTLNMARVRAVESNRYFIMSGNFVPSFVLDNKGRVLVESDWGKTSVIHREVSLIFENSFYLKIGRLTFWLAVFLIIILSLYKKYTRKKH